MTTRLQVAKARVAFAERDVLRAHRKVERNPSAKNREELAKLRTILEQNRAEYRTAVKESIGK